jgi:hypothetical protein
MVTWLLVSGPVGMTAHGGGSCLPHVKQEARDRNTGRGQSKI